MRRRLAFTHVNAYPRGLLVPRFDVDVYRPVHKWYGHELQLIPRREAYVFGCFPRLKERLRQSGSTLSGGEQQMLAIARCLMMRPKLIILDEPTEGIMPRLVSQIRREIHRINLTGVSILLVEQNVETALRLCPRVFLMEKGTNAAVRAGWDSVHPKLGLTKRFYDWFTPAISERDFRIGDGNLDKALDFLAVLRP